MFTELPGIDSATARAMIRARGINSCVVSSSQENAVRSSFKGSQCGDRTSIVSARGFRPAGTRWPISTDLQNCHHSSILSAHCIRQKSPTQVSRYEARLGQGLVQNERL